MVLGSCADTRPSAAVVRACRRRPRPCRRRRFARAGSPSPLGVADHVGPAVQPRATGRRCAHECVDHRRRAQRPAPPPRRSAAPGDRGDHRPAATARCRRTNVTRVSSSCTSPSQPTPIGASSPCLLSCGADGFPQVQLESARCYSSQVVSPLVLGHPSVCSPHPPAASAAGGVSRLTLCRPMG